MFFPIFCACLCSQLTVASVDYTQSALPVGGTSASSGDNCFPLEWDRCVVSGWCGSDCPYDACAGVVWKALWKIQVKNKIPGERL